MKDLKEVDRLDLAARAEAVDVLLYQGRVVWTLLAAVFVLLAYGSRASSYETEFVRVVAMLAVVATLLIWLKSRFAAYGLVTTVILAGLGP